MKIYHGFGDKALSAFPRSAAIGVFDGVHRGHERILKQAIAQARRAGQRCIVVTFDPHPSRILGASKKAPIILSLEHRLRLFQAIGVQETLVIRFNRAFSKITADDFVRQYLKKRLGVQALFVGRDFRFGRGGAGCVRFLEKWKRDLKYSLFVIPPLRAAGGIISSTRIRQLIEKGSFAQAARLLGRPVSVYGTVLRGRGRGHRVGFPTANLNPHHETLPPEGVYAAWGEYKGRRLKGVLHIGRRPTFADRQKSLEIHFLDFQANLYGQEIELFFVKRLRGIRRFSDPEALGLAIRQDISAARRILGR